MTAGGRAHELRLLFSESSMSLDEILSSELSSCCTTSSLAIGLTDCEGSSISQSLRETNHVR